MLKRAIVSMQARDCIDANARLRRVSRLHRIASQLHLIDGRVCSKSSFAICLQKYKVLTVTPDHLTLDKVTYNGDFRVTVL